jgi:hypothetical protein
MIQVYGGLVYQVVSVRLPDCLGAWRARGFLLDHLTAYRGILFWCIPLGVLQLRSEVGKSWTLAEALVT